MDHQENTVKVFPNGDKRWYRDGELHRTDGPAVECSNGAREWYLDGKRHRTDGPAIEHADGAKYWYQEDKLHRTDGPAIEYADGTREWYLYGKEVTEEEVMNSQVRELTVQEISELLGYEIKVVK